MVLSDTTFTHNSCGNEGGAIQAGDKGSIILHGETAFTGNQAVRRCGGAISLSGSSKVAAIAKTAGVTRFINNVAVYGGGIHAVDNASYLFQSPVEFLNNSVVVKGSGSAINAWDNANVVMSGVPNRFDGHNGSAVALGDNVQMQLHAGVNSGGI